MAIRKQLSIFLENRPGAMSRVGDALKENEINIQGLTVSDTVDHAVLRMIVDNPQKAISIFEERNILILEGEVVEAKIPHSPGGFADFAAKLAEAEINIDYAYGSMASGNGDHGVVYVHTGNPQKAEDILQKHQD